MQILCTVISTFLVVFHSIDLSSQSGKEIEGIESLTLGSPPKEQPRSTRSSGFQPWYLPEESNSQSKQAIEVVRKDSPSSPPKEPPRSMHGLKFEPWFLPEGVFVQVVATMPSKRFFQLKPKWNYNIQRNEDGEIFAMRIDLTRYALYDAHDRRAALNMKTGLMRQLEVEEEKFLDRDGKTMKLGPRMSAAELRRLTQELIAAEELHERRLKERTSG